MDWFDYIGIALLAMLAFFLSGRRIRRCPKYGRRRMRMTGLSMIFNGHSVSRLSCKSCGSEFFQNGDGPLEHRPEGKTA